MPGHPLARSLGTCACIKAPSAASRLSRESFPENQDRLMFIWDGGGAVGGRGPLQFPGSPKPHLCVPLQRGQEKKRLGLAV